MTRDAWGPTFSFTWWLSAVMSVVFTFGILGWMAVMFVKQVRYDRAVKRGEHPEKWWLF